VSASIEAQICIKLIVNFEAVNAAFCVVRTFLRDIWCLNEETVLDQSGELKHELLSADHVKIK